MFYSIAEAFLIPIIVTNFSKGFSKNLVLFLLLIYGWFQIEKGINYYKEDLGVDIFRPYNSVLIDNTYNAMDKK